MSVSAVVGVLTGLPTGAAVLASIARGGVLSIAGLPVLPRSRQSAIANSGRNLVPTFVFIDRLSSDNHRENRGPSQGPHPGHPIDQPLPSNAGADCRIDESVDGGISRIEQIHHVLKLPRWSRLTVEAELPFGAGDLGVELIDIRQPRAGIDNRIDRLLKLPSLICLGCRQRQQLPAGHAGVVLCAPPTVHAFQQ